MSRCRLLDNSKVRVVNNLTSRHLGSTNVELFQNSTKMQNSGGQLSQRNRATLAFVPTPQTRSSCSKIRRKCRVLKVIYRAENARRLCLNSTLEQRRVVPKFDENAEFSRSAIAAKPRDARLCPNSSNVPYIIRRQCRILDIIPEKPRNSRLHCSNNVELFQNWTKMQNSQGQLSRRNRATLFEDVRLYTPLLDQRRVVP